MRSFKLKNKGFSLTELMIAMTILAFGLLSMAQMQMMALRGTTSAREFSEATKIAREGMERWKITGVFVIESGTTSGLVKNDKFQDWNTNTSDSIIAPVITSQTDVSTLQYDLLEVFVEDPNDPMSLVDAACTAKFGVGGGCDLTGNWDYVRITNTRNVPLTSTEEKAVLKEVNTIVLWEERDRTRSVSMRTLVGRKDNAFY